MNGPHNSPFAHCRDLGWGVIGEVCLGSVHKSTVNSYKTNVLESGRSSIFEPCPSFIHIKDTKQGFDQPNKTPGRMLGQTMFNRTENDNKPAPSVEDIVFLEIMDKHVSRDEDNNWENSWVAPLPFRNPNNKEQAVKRYLSLQKTLKKRPEMQEQYVAFMEKIFANGHVEVAPPLKTDEECWYLPSFGVFHPQKPDQIRVVFDSSAQYSGVSLNDVLLTGPDLNNSLLEVLLPFRKEKVAILADIQLMFHCFLVNERSSQLSPFFVA